MTQRCWPIQRLSQAKCQVKRSARKEPPRKQHSLEIISRTPNCPSRIERTARSTQRLQSRQQLVTGPPRDSNRIQRVQSNQKANQRCFGMQCQQQRSWRAGACETNSLSPESLPLGCLGAIAPKAWMLIRANCLQLQRIGSPSLHHPPTNRRHSGHVRHHLPYHPCQMGPTPRCLLQRAWMRPSRAPLKQMHRGCFPQGNSYRIHWGPPGPNIQRGMRQPPCQGSKAKSIALQCMPVRVGWNLGRCRAPLASQEAGSSWNRAKFFSRWSLRGNRSDDYLPRISAPPQTTKQEQFARMFLVDREALRTID